MIDLAILAVLLVVGLGAGRRVLRSVPFTSGLEEAVFALALALALLGYVTLALGEAGLLVAPVLWAVVAAAALYGWRTSLAALARAGRALRTRDPAVLLAVAGMALLVAAELVPVLAPPVGGDQTKYHLVYPRLWADAHRILPTPWS